MWVGGRGEEIPKNKKREILEKGRMRTQSKGGGLTWMGGKE